MKGDKRDLDVDLELNLTVKAAKKSLTPKHEPDWDAIDAKLFERIDAADASERAGRVARLGPASRTRGWSLVAGGLAAAAALAVYAGHKPNTAPIDRAAMAPAPVTASALVRPADGEKRGEVLVAGAPATTGALLHVGEVIETHGATALLEREASGGSGGSGAPLVAWSVEEDSRVAIVKATGALVVSLERGALEAQVMPVPSGEAFAVDVPGPSGSVTRVAVHGTHLRVSRVVVGDHVKLVVDLSEGVVSIGAPPRAGSTYGALVTAPAHIELDTADPSSLVVSHLPEDVRAPVDLALARAASPASAVAQAPPASSVPRALAQATPHTPPASPQIARPVPAAPRAPVADPNAEANVAAAVKACMAARTRAPDGEVTVTVSSTLELRLHEDGAVDLARFSPPLPPDVQLCAANAIYKTRFPRSGTLTIDLKF